MRTWGRVTGEDGRRRWVAVETAESGDNTQVWLTTLIQTLKLNLGESPLFTQYGIPAQQSVMTQVYPDYYVNMVQQQFAGYFASLTVRRVTTIGDPVYEVEVVTLNGATYREKIAV